MFPFYPPEGAKDLFDAKRYVVTTRSASGKPMWRTAQETWSYLRQHAATFTSQQADDEIKKAVPTDGSRAATPVKELAA